MINNIDNSNVYLEVSEIKSDSPVLNKLNENVQVLRLMELFIFGILYIIRKLSLIHI